MIFNKIRINVSLDRTLAELIYCLDASWTKALWSSQACKSEPSAMFPHSQCVQTTFGSQVIAGFVGGRNGSGWPAGFCKPITWELPWLASVWRGKTLDLRGSDPRRRAQSKTNEEQMVSTGVNGKVVVDLGGICYGIRATQPPPLLVHKFPSQYLDVSDLQNELCAISPPTWYILPEHPARSFLFCKLKSLLCGPAYSASSWRVHKTPQV